MNTVSLRCDAIPKFVLRCSNRKSHALDNDEEECIIDPETYKCNDINPEGLKLPAKGDANRDGGYRPGGLALGRIQ